MHFINNAIHVIELHHSVVFCTSCLKNLILYSFLTEDIPGQSGNTGNRTGRGKALPNGRGERNAPVRRTVPKRTKRVTSFTHHGKQIEINAIFQLILVKDNFRILYYLRYLFLYMILLLRRECLSKTV